MKKSIDQIQFYELHDGKCLLVIEGLCAVLDPGEYSHLWLKIQQYHHDYCDETHIVKEF